VLLLSALANAAWGIVELDASVVCALVAYGLKG